MRKPDLVLGVIVHHGESDIALSIDPHGERIPVGYEHPLPYIKLFLVYYQRILNILLNDPVAPSALTNVFQYVVEFAHYNDTAPSGSGPRLDDPKVLITPNVELSVFLFKLS